jgi:hypothetical protein
MSEQVLGQVTYWQGHRLWGEQRRKGTLIIDSNNLIFRGDSGEELQMPLIASNNERMHISSVNSLWKGGIANIIAYYLTDNYTAHGLAVMFYDEVTELKTTFYFRCPEQTAKIIAETVTQAIYVQRRQGK